MNKPMKPFKSNFVKSAVKSLQININSTPSYFEFNFDKPFVH